MVWLVKFCQKLFILSNFLKIVKIVKKCPNCKQGGEEGNSKVIYQRLVAKFTGIIFQRNKWVNVRLLSIIMSSSSSQPKWAPLSFSRPPTTQIYTESLSCSPSPDNTLMMFNQFWMLVVPCNLHLFGQKVVELGRSRNNFDKWPLPRMTHSQSTSVEFPK